MGPCSFQAADFIITNKQFLSVLPSEAGMQNIYALVLNFMFEIFKWKMKEISSLM